MRLNECVSHRMTNQPVHAQLAGPTCIVRVVCRNLLSRILRWGVLQGIQLSPEGSKLLPLLGAPEGGLLSCQPHCCVIQLSLQACTKMSQVTC